MADDSAFESEAEQQSRFEAATPEGFATWIVQRLQESGYQALFAGGCVRDQRLGVAPKDFDVATAATPDQVRRIFGHRRTLPVGAAFGVITVIGSRATGNVEVATFRCDGEYSDGRHPDGVTFSDAEHDAQRRDFTINGLFYDPIRRQVLDYVGGEADLRQRLIRAIGCPRARFGEDHLRMLRAIRFTTVLNFELEPTTLAAIQDLAPQIATISGERIAMEMQKLLNSPHRGRGIELLHQSGLLGELIPGLDCTRREPDLAFRRLCSSLSRDMGACSACDVSLGVLLIWDRLETMLAGRRGPPRETRSSAAADLPLTALTDVVRSCQPLVEQLVKRWRLSNETKSVFRALQEWLPTVALAERLPWSQVQPAVTAPSIWAVLTAADCLHSAGWIGEAGPARCREVLSWPAERLNPPPYFSGGDLLALGVPAGRGLGVLLRRARQLQLDGQWPDRNAALGWVQHQLGRTP